MLRSEFIEMLDSDLRAISFSSGISNNSALAEYACKLLEEANETTSMELGSANLVVGTKRRKIRIDAFGFDPIDNTLFALAADAADKTGDSTLTKTDADVIFSQLSWFVEVALRDELRAEIPTYEHAAQFAWSLAENWPQVKKVKLILVTNRTLSGRVRSYESQDIDGKESQAQIWDETRIHELLESKTGREDTKISLADFGLERLPLLRANTTFEGTQTYLSVLPGVALARIFDKFGSRLLEGNVRGFLSVRGTVNKGMRATILGEPERFLAFNNGITATATDITLDQEGNLETIENFQIVNGGQTTASLYHFLKNEKVSSDNLSKTAVAMKLIVVSPELADELVPSIAKYSNSQNKVNEADFFANSPFHRRMEEISKRLLAPAVGGRQVSTKWYYERARGSFENERTRAALSAPALRRFDDSHPKNQKIDKTDLAKFHSIFSLKPHLARRGNQKNFIAFKDEVSPKWETEQGKALFGDAYYKKIVCTKIIYESTHKAVRESAWYEQGYLADIVTHGISKFIYHVEDRDLALPWDVIWQQQSVPLHLMTSILESCRSSLDALLDPTRRQQNVTEWSKSEDCWNAVKRSRLDFSRELLAVLVSKGASEDSKLESRQQTLVLSELETLTYLQSIPAGYWDEVESHQNVRMSPTARQSLQKVREGKGLLLDKRRADGLILLIEMASHEGIARPTIA